MIFREVSPLFVRHSRFRGGDDFGSHAHIRR
jgi:hypothetical protein